VIKEQQMKTKHLLYILSILLFLLASNASYATLATSGSIYLNSEPGSWVGGGIGEDSVTWQHGDEGIFDISTNSFNYGAFVTFNDGNRWSFNFVAPTYDPTTNTNDGNLLEVAFFDNATRYPFNSPTRPGLDFSGNGRGNNQLGGWFDVREITYDESFTEILSFAVDFRQFDESEQMTGPSTFGSLRINSDIPLNFTLAPVPESDAYAMLLAGLALISVATNKKRARKQL
jgi:hypothetical protein